MAMFASTSFVAHEQVVHDIVKLAVAVSHGGNAASCE